MISITRWAGRHPWLVRLFLVPALFYLHSRIAFILGAELYFDQTELSLGWVVALLGVLIAVTYVYPSNPREVMRQQYARLKSLEALGCMAAFGLWVYVGNQTAAYFETEAQTEQTAPIRSAEQASLDVSGKSTRQERGFLAPVRRAIKAYYRGAIARIKAAKRQRTQEGEGLPRGLAIALGVVGIALGIIVLVCGIACGTASGGIALAVIGGLALVGLGIWSLIHGLRKKAPKPAVSP